eukprot:Sspe_Gene.89036::Locus_60906_Transcript_1_1_Confidence_1.000_Length_525::g.89036::m.89036
MNSAFTCNCRAPAMGMGTNMPATCVTEDDCTAGAVCGTGQTCADADGIKNGAYICNCDAPKSGSGTNAPATCTDPVGDCATATCGAGQECQDADGMADTKFKCVCQPPNTGSADSAPVAMCTPPPDDCGATPSPCGMDQDCKDSDGKANGFFECTCKAPLVGSEKNKAATCAMA